MLFDYKPDYEDARRHWEAFWAGELIDRPCIQVTAPKHGCVQSPHPRGLYDPGEDLLAHVAAYDRYASTTYFGGDAIPFFFPNFGPDVYAAFLGAELEFAIDIGTSWAKPFVTDWRTDTPKMAVPHGRIWQSALRFVSDARKIAEGRFGIAMFDLHSNLDCLAAARGPQQLCLDLLDRPDEIEQAMATVRRAYAPIYDAVFEAAGGSRTGSTTWLPMYSPGKFSAIQCDFICMIGPEHVRRFVVPALEEEAEFLDHCCFHYDGPDALIHFDDIMSIKPIEAIQWVPGAGNPPMIEWMDLLKRMQDRGKSVYVGASVEEVKLYHSKLRPDRVAYHVAASSQAEADALIEWLADNT